MVELEREDKKELLSCYASYITNCSQHVTEEERVVPVPIEWYYQNDYQIHLSETGNKPHLVPNYQSIQEYGNLLTMQFDQYQKIFIFYRLYVAECLKREWLPRSMVDIAQELEQIA